MEEAQRLPFSMLTNRGSLSSIPYPMGHQTRGNMGNLRGYIPRPFSLGLNLKFWVGPEGSAFIDFPENAEMEIHRAM